MWLLLPAAAVAELRPADGGGASPARAPLGGAGERRRPRGLAPPAAQMSSAHRAGDAAGCGSAFPIAAEAEEAVWGRHGNCRRRR